MFKPSLERKSIRFRDYDYSTGGLFFITICTQGHKCILGRVKDYEIELSPFGNSVLKRWLSFENANIKLHEFVIMPNHFHAIIKLEQFSLGDLICDFKSLTTRDFIEGVKDKGWPRFDKRIWQRNYFEHIIRNEKSLFKIAEYIENNPAKWHEDKFYKAKK